MDANQVTSFFRMLQSDGWTYTYYGNYWRARGSTARRSILVYVGLQPAFVTFQLPLGITVEPACRPALYRLLAQLSHKLKVIKCVADDYDRVSFTAELPASALSLYAFKEVLAAMRVYFEQYAREIELLAGDPVLANTWLSLAPVVEEAAVRVVSDVSSA